MKIVMANSIGIDSEGYHIIHSPSRWSEGVKDKGSRFTYYPWELAYCSSLLKKYTAHYVKFVDGCLERLNYKQYLGKIKDEDPDWLIIESSSRMIDENLNLAKALKNELGTKVIFVGQHASAFPEYMLNNGTDYVCIGEYEYTVLELMQGRNPNDILGLYPNPRRPLLDINSLPWPEDEDVSRLSYGIPGEPSSEYLEIQMYGSRGCRGSCDFCVARNVYYAQPNWRQRETDDIISELKYLRNKYPQMEGIFFDEEEHNASKDFILKLTDGIINAGLNDLRYEAMCDARSLDKETMEAMHRAGYYKVRIGIETTSLEVLRNNRKPLNINRIERRLEEAKEIGLKTYGTFMIGMPGSSRETDLNTVKYIDRMILNGLLDNVQISICTPQPGTPFYEEVSKQGYLISREFKDYDGGRRAVVGYPGYSNSSIESVMAFAFRSREHASFLRNLRKRKMLGWVLRTYRKYGFLATVLKLLKRMRFELPHLLLKRETMGDISGGAFCGSIASTISVIIPNSSDSKNLPILSFLKESEYPEDKIEVILSIGRWPSIQRNCAAGVAKGDILYFINRDTRLEPDIFSKIVRIINKDEKIAGVGGPDLTPVDNSYAQHLFGYAMGSYFAHWKMRARYLQVGRERVSNESELLLSNLAVRREVYLKANGFDKRLYPNEENELINRISKMGYRFIYSPDMKVYRDRRRSFFEFARQFFKYGQGRMNQILIEGGFKNLPFLCPLLLLIYLILLPFLEKNWFSFVPLSFYGILGVINAFYLSFKNKKNMIIQLPIAYIIMHISYALGMISRMPTIFKKTQCKKNKHTQVRIKRVYGKDRF